MDDDDDDDDEVTLGSSATPPLLPSSQTKIEPKKVLTVYNSAHLSCRWPRDHKGLSASGDYCARREIGFREFDSSSAGFGN